MSILLACRFDAAEWAAWLPALQAALPGEILWRAEDGFDADAVEIAIVANPPPGALAGCRRLRLIQSLWAGVDKLLADPSLPAGVPIARMVDPAMTAAMVETALWAVLGLHRGFFDYRRQQALARWQQLPQRRADEVTVLVLGLGELGGTLARRLAAHGYRVQGWSRQPRQIDGVACQAGEAALPGQLGAADIVVNLLPLTDETRDFFGAVRLAQFKPGASLVNLARGAQVVEADLLAALDAGPLQHAVLDVFRQEPLPAGHAFWRHPAVTVLPHVAALTDPRSAAALVAANVAALRSGAPIAHQVERGQGY
jgi:glyoxylate/hydroxypyruvate reductase A